MGEGRERTYVEGIVENEMSEMLGKKKENGKRLIYILGDYVKNK